MLAMGEMLYQEILEKAPGWESVVRVDLLPYNKSAGAKYNAAGMQFRPGYDETRGLNLNTLIFEQLAIEVRVK